MMELTLRNVFLCLPCVYIWMYCHPQTDCFVILQLISVARHIGHFKVRLKPAKLYVRLSIIPLIHWLTYVSLGIIRHYVVAFACLYLPYRIPEGSVDMNSFALCEWQPLCIYKPLPWKGYNTRSIFMQRLTGLNSEFSFSEISCHFLIYEPTTPNYLPIARGTIVGFIPFPRVLALCEMQTALSRICAHVAACIFLWWYPVHHKCLL